MSGKPPFVQIAVQAFACAFCAPDVPALSLHRLETALARHEDVPFTGDQRAFVELVRRAPSRGHAAFTHDLFEKDS